LVVPIPAGFKDRPAFTTRFRAVTLLAMAPLTMTLFVLTLVAAMFFAMTSLAMTSFAITSFALTLPGTPLFGKWHIGVAPPAAVTGPAARSTAGAWRLAKAPLMPRPGDALAATRLAGTFSAFQDQLRSLRSLAQ
jgi:hypothetical protein